ncbi:hypothetical protein MSEO_04340 [Mycobacterium seoulense]|uniref:Uncharacterized protein n=1 Tax=Mycobacterium seoulense TaxID=386911 RepID=A0A7I7NU06_9MYCO|nr:hypothetical protein MSEO_04340 [Mycobacterium seoulense]
MDPGSTADTQNVGARMQFVQAETTFVVLNPPVGRGDDDVECDHGGHETQYARGTGRAPPGKK